MFTLMGYHKAAISATLLPLQPIADPHVTVSGNDLTVPELNQIVALLCVGGAPTQAQMQSPSLRKLIQEDIPAYIATEVCTGAVDVIVDKRDNPLILTRSEKLNGLTIHTTDGRIFVWLADGPISPISGDIRTVKCTTGHTTAADLWENLALTFTQTLPAGRYAVVGMHAHGTNLLAARLVFVGGGWRPGVVAGAIAADPGIPMFRNGAFGLFGEFEFDQPPSIDLLGTGVTSTEEVYLDLIQIRVGR